MKKTYKILALTIMVLFVISAVCCSAVPVTFKHTWSATGTYGTFEETLTYKVYEQDNFKYGSYDYSKTNENTIPTNHVGTYVVKLTAVSAGELPQVAKNAYTASENLKNETQFYKIETGLSVHSVYVFPEKTYEFTDVIGSISYFTSCTTNNLSPLYSEKTYDTTMLNENNVIVRYAYTTSLVYNNEVAHLTVIDNRDNVTSIYDADTTRYKKGYANFDSALINQSDIEYTERETIDNEQLILGARGLTITENALQKLEVIDPTYRTVKTINLRKIGSGEETFENNATNKFNLIINGVEKWLTGATPAGDYMKVSTNIVAMSLNADHFTGTPILCYFQNGVVANENSNFPVKMCYALPFSNGALIYELRDININE